MEQAPLTNQFRGIHIEQLQIERIRFKPVWNALKKGWERHVDVTYTSNSLGFQYRPVTDEVSVYVTYLDGSDEVRLTRKAFETELRKHQVGGPHADP